jgi:hypothetical protein
MEGWDAIDLSGGTMDRNIFLGSFIKNLIL